MAGTILLRWFLIVKLAIVDCDVVFDRWIDDYCRLLLHTFEVFDAILGILIVRFKGFMMMDWVLLLRILFLNVLVLLSWVDEVLWSPVMGLSSILCIGWRLMVILLKWIVVVIFFVCITLLSLILRLSVGAWCIKGHTLGWVRDRQFATYGDHWGRRSLFFDLSLTKL